MTRAYNESYLSDAKDTLSQCFDYLINDCDFSADWTATLFLTSGYAELFERGNPGVIAGKSGVELAKSIVQVVRDYSDVFRLSRDGYQQVYRGYGSQVFRTASGVEAKGHA